MDAFEARIRCLEIASDLYETIGEPYKPREVLKAADVFWTWFMAIAHEEPEADQQPITETRQ